MTIKRTKLRIGGMTCPSCQARIQAALAGLQGVESVEVSLERGEATVEHGLEDLAVLEAAVEGAGYSVLPSGLAARAAELLPALALGLLLSGAYLAAGAAGLFNNLPRIDSSLGYGALFVVGLLTSAHCVAMCGGIALSQSLGSAGARESGGEARTGAAPGRLERLGPGLLYNGGRILSYTLLGGLAGALGSALDFSPAAKGAVTGLAAILMLAFGLSSLGLFPRPSRPGRFLPKAAGRAAARAAAALRKRGPFAVGLLGGLMPCGPLQTMQLYALGTGGFLPGASAMFVFALGTAPLLLGFGLAAALMPLRRLSLMRKTSAVLVIFLAFVTFGRAAALAGIALPGLALAGRDPASATLSRPRGGDRGGATAAREGAAPLLAAGVQPRLTAAPSAAALAALPRARLDGGVQSITTEFGANRYQAFVVQAGVPLKWTIRVRAEDLNGCNNPFVVPALRLKKTLVPGDNLVEFTPGAPGAMPYSCWMGMIRSRIEVVASLADAPSASPPSARLAGFGGPLAASALPSGVGGSPSGLAEAGLPTCCGLAAAGGKADPETGPALPLDLRSVP